jgi:tRNA-specific 2-thiouridylase
VPKALALISGSLDSEVAAKLVQRVGCELTCAVFNCPFQHQTGAAETATRLNSPLVTLAPDPAFLDIVRRPRFNFGGGPLSCLECRARMLLAAARKAKSIGADLIVTGEVLGQRATNQSRRQIDLLSYHSGVGDRLYRPLSAKLLGAPAGAIELGIDAASQSISGSGRRPIRDLAKRLNLAELDRAGPQCRLNDPEYMSRLDDLLMNQADADLIDVELLRYGRHFRISREAKAIVGRNAADNDAIGDWSHQHGRGRLFVPSNFQGPTLLWIGGLSSEIEIGLSLAASRKSETPPGGFEFLHQGGTLRLTMLRETVTLQSIRAQ